MDPEDVMTRSSELPDVVLRYAPHADGLVDVHLPPGPSRPRPLVYLVHGGFWKQEYDRRPVRPLANALAADGFVVAVPEYRRVGGGGGWPATVDDVDAALRVTPRLLAESGIPTTTTTLVGHSAGGHLVLWLANQPHDVDRAVALAPVANLREAAEDGLSTDATVGFLGGTPEQVPEVYDAADPATRMRTRPRTQVVVLHGDVDEDVPVQISRNLKGRFDWIDYRELPGVEHFGVIDPLSHAWPEVRRAIRGEAG